MTPLSGAWNEGSPTLRTDKPLEMTIGAASPLWFLFAGAAATGAAFWWMKQWVQPVNLEAILGAAAKPSPAPPQPSLESVAEGGEEPVALQAMAEPAFAAPVSPAEAVSASLTSAVGEAQTQAAQIAEAVIDATADAVGVMDTAADSAVTETTETLETVAKSAAPKGKGKARTPPTAEG